MAAASAPGVSTGSAESTGATTAILDGRVTTNGAITTLRAEYALTASSFCTSGGASGSPASVIGGDLSADEEPDYYVQVTLTGLATGGHYCARMTAQNGFGTGNGELIEFFVGRPKARAQAAASISASAAEVYGYVEPFGTATSYRVEYVRRGLTGCDDATDTPIQTAPVALGSLEEQVPVTVGVTGLTPRARYCFTLLATNTAGPAPRDTPSQLMVGLPGTSITSVTVTGPSTATLAGEVDTAGQATQFAAAYDSAMSNWCTSAGNDGSPAHTTALGGPAPPDGGLVSVAITGLTPGDAYCVRLVAQNGTGLASEDPDTSRSPRAFRAGTPLVSAEASTPTGATSMRIGGAVTPSNQTTQYSVTYAPAAAAFCGGAGGSPQTTSAQTLAAVDTVAHPVSVDVPALTTGTAYCARLSATNGSGTAIAVDTLTFIAGQPRATAASVRATSTSAATLSGAVNPAGLSTTYRVSVGPSTGEWCISGAYQGAPSLTGDAITLPDTDAQFHAVTVQMTGLNAGEEFCAMLIAANAGGSVTSLPVDFTAGLASAIATDVTLTGATGADVHGSVNPAGQVTHYRVAYDLATAQSCNSSDIPEVSSANFPLPEDAVDHDVSVSLAGLTMGQRYCAAIVASNDSGIAVSDKLFFTVAGPAPNTSIESAPSGVSTLRRPSITFGSPAAGATFACKLDGAAYAGCTSPFVPATDLADGGHSFSVRAMFGGVTDGTPASASWTVDATAPDTAITGGPAEGATVTDSSVQVAFSATEQGVAFACTLDGAAVASCASPQPLSGLAIGSHTFTVAATDPAGNADMSPATRAFTVAAPAGAGGTGATGGTAGTGGGTGPAGTVSSFGAPTSAVKGSGIVVSTGRRITCPAGSGGCTVSVVLTTTAKLRATKATIGTATISVPAGQTKALSAKLTKAAVKRLRKLKKLKTTATVRVRTARGTVSAPVTWSFTIKLPKKKRA